MTNSGDNPDRDAGRADAPTAQPGVWTKTTFFRITAILGRRRAESLLTDYVSYLDRAQARIEATCGEAIALRRTLHDLRSTSGMLGFDALSELCLAMLSDAAENLLSANMARLRELTHQSGQAARQYLVTAGLTAAA